eukprot:CAMPEP_0117608744 /NCGR_PEP_ID=MMETSP0784-20121206/80963_1 /TAXON_ID=39447 /ORGANISM="" /LENGTH=60 /DNA_ID=CAMNT_0005412021 /DNA_START=61 /DNA_END=244 /DNA_ORIENTATION=+
MKSSAFAFAALSTPVIVEPPVVEKVVFPLTIGSTAPVEGGFAAAMRLGAALAAFAHSDWP